MSYAERKNRWNPKLANARTKPGAIERQRLWNALNEYVHQQGGAVTSLPPRWPLRVEVGQGSSLPAKFSELGYRTYHVGKTMRVTNNGIQQVDVIELGLPR